MSPACGSIQSSISDIESVAEFVLLRRATSHTCIMSCHPVCRFYCFMRRPNSTRKKFPATIYDGTSGKCQRSKGSIRWLPTANVFRKSRCSRVEATHSKNHVPAFPNDVDRRRLYRRYCHLPVRHGSVGGCVSSPVASVSGVYRTRERSVVSVPATPPRVRNRSCPQFAHDLEFVGEQARFTL